MLDVGGESTRPGADPVSLEDELARVVPVIAELSRRVSVPLSVDTWKADVARAAVAVPLPHPTEGFFLPGLEAMALGCPLVMPDCRGNGEYAMDDGNCLMPAAEPGALAAAVERLLADPALAARLVVAGQETAARDLLASEREAFAALLDRLWP